VSVILRILELCCAVIVAGIVGQYLHYLDLADVHAGSRIIYTEVIAGISILFSIIFMPPLKYSFYGFIIDFALFICWMVAFGLMENLTGGHGCSSYWYWSSWGYYWGRYWYTVPLSSTTQSLVGTAACGEWKAALSFSFIGGWTWFVSMLLGVYVCTKVPEHEVATTKMNTVSKASTSINRWYHKYTRKTGATPANGATATTYSETGETNLDGQATV